MNQDFSALLFGKPWEDIGLPDIEAFFKREQSESDKLEFKSIPINYAGQKEDDRKILKSICGFLNAEGGVLVWGAPEENKKNTDFVQKYSGTLTPTSVFHEKDAFIAKLANRIVPSPKGIRFKVIPVNDKFIYIIDVPHSQFPPHQFENIYYMRMDGQTKAAPHHYIEALFRRVTFPRLEAYLRIDDYLPENSDLFSIKCTVLFMNFSRYQNDENLHCRIISDQGRIMTLHSNPSPLDTGIEIGSDYIPGVIAPMIYYGNFAHHTFKLSLSRKRLAETGHQCNIRLHFGARYSPMKLSFYKLQVASALEEGRRNDIIFEKRENMFFHENEEAQGWSEQGLIEQNLKS